MTVAFLGLGSMGAGMARNLVRAGLDVIVWNRTAAKTREVEGARPANSIAEAAAAGVAFTMLADDAALESVVFGPGGMLETLPAGGLHVSMSTISRSMSERLAAAHAKAGQEYISAPVFGRPEAAEKQQLVIIAAGSGPAIDRVRGALEAMGRKLVVVGDQPWKANVFKLCGNFMIAAMLETLSESFALARKSGLDASQFLDVLNGELFRSPVYENYGRLILSEQFEPAGFKAKLGFKDVRLAIAASEAAEAPIPFASVLHDNFLALIATGGGEKDWAALSAVAAGRAGL
ncbi:MAG TPA: NAD(P)-dependent oxidoreductase [Bryobacteraceae bacterium]|nr:NAD(P)-dependent oxidoreductase [Bryobacteraceae bacterium]